jgi:AcrR family transcriptional regulator
MPSISLEQILDTAEAIARERGLDALTLETLGTSLKLSRATIYRRVNSRENLLSLLSERGFNAGPDAASTRDRILAAAREVFPSLGLDATTMEAIAAAASVGTATVYRHFADKKSLISAFIASISPRAQAWALARDPSGDLRTDLLTLATLVLTFASKEPKLLLFFLTERLRGNPEVAAVENPQTRSLHAITALLKAHLGNTLNDPEAERYARAFLGLLMMFGPIGQWLGSPAEGSIEAKAEFVVNLFVEGLMRCEAERSSECSIKLPLGH